MMGILIHNDQKISITNWRIITKHKSSVILVTQFYEVFLIKNINLSEIKKVADSKGKVKIPFYFLGTVLTCESCSGQGYKNWIEVATGKPDQMYVYDDCIKFTRSGEITRQKSYDIILHLSKRAGIKKGMEYCPACKGTGVRLYSLARIIEVKT